MTLLSTITPAAELSPRNSRRFLLSGAGSDPGEMLVLSPEPEALLTGAQRRAVLTSLREGRASLGGRSWRAGFARIVFGMRQPAAYADDRLEMLRRYAILYRLEGGALSLDEDKRLLAAGLSSRQTAAARALVDAHYMPGRDAPRVPWTFAAMIGLAAAAAALFYRWIAVQFDDSAGALLITILLATWAVSIVSITSHPHGRPS